MNLSAPSRALFPLLLALGALGFAAALLLGEPARAWAGLLLAGWLLLGLGVGALAYLALLQVTGARWSEPILPLLRAALPAVPAGGLAVLVTAVGAGTLYPWADAAAVHADEVLRGREGWMSLPFVLARGAILLGVLSWIARRFARGRETTGSAAGTLLFLLFGFSLLGFDWIVSLDRTWYSTIFAAQQLVGAFLGAAAAVALAAGTRARRHDGPGEETRHDLGKVLFAAAFFWGYLWFCQFMLIWYTDNPEETSWFLVRHRGSWAVVSVAVVLLNWLVPFVALLSRHGKRNPVVLSRVAAAVLLGRWAEAYLTVLPQVSPSAPPLGPAEIGLPVAAFALYVALRGGVMRRVPSPALPILVAAAAILAAAALAEAGEPKAPKRPEPPKYEVLRFREDWRPYLCDPSRGRCDPSDRMKAIPLTRDRCLWVSFGGQVRFRTEHTENFNLSPASANDDGWLLTRLRAHADLHAGRHLRAFAEGIWADQEERTLGPRASDENHGDLLNGFVEGKVGAGGGTEVGLRGGREQLLFGKERLIGASEWANTRRTFDGAHAWVARGAGWSLDAFWVRPVVVDIEEFDEADDRRQLAGLYYANRCRKDCLEWEAYALWYESEGATWLGVTGDESRFTVGGRAWGKAPRARLDWEVEAAGQFGDFDGGTISAGFATAEVGWKPCAPCWEPRLAVGLDWASGDGDGPGGDLGTFNPLFTTGHRWFGYADLLGRQNMLAARLSASVQPTKAVTLTADFHEFWRADESDAAYNAAGGVLRAPSGSEALHTGSEFDLVAKWKIGRHIDLEAGWGHFFPGAFLRGTGAHETVDFLYAQILLTF